MVLGKLVALAGLLSVVSAAVCSLETTTVVSTKTVYVTGSSTTSLAKTSSTKTTSTTSISTTTTSSGPVVSVYGQCGGIGYVGPTVCAPGSTCIYNSPYFSQCLPSSSTTVSAATTPITSAPRSSTSVFTSIKPSSTSTKSTVSTVSTASTTSAPTTTGPPIVTVPIYGQCGGLGYNGPTVCAPGLICTKENDYFSNCFAGPDYTPSPTPTPSVTITIVYPPKQTFNYLFSFGDDFSITGFNLSGTKPSDDNQLGNPTYPGVTTTGGMNWIDRIITNNVGLLSYNFASAGATIDATLIPPNGTNALTLVDQVTEFTSNLGPHPDYAPWNSSLSLFVIWIGMHDVGASYDDINWPAISESLINSYFAQAQLLYNAGARFFAFGNIPPLQRAPNMLLQSAASQQAEATAISIFNTMQANSAQAFVDSNPGVDVQVVDMQGPFNVMLDNPTVYGAPNASCYNLDGVSCLWWNEYYPGFNISTFCGDAISVVEGLYL